MSSRGSDRLLLALALITSLVPSLVAQEAPRRTLHVYGPGGPLAPMQEAAERFGRARGVRVVVTGGPEAQWIDRAKLDADLIYGGAEYMLSQFAMKHPDLVDGSTREELYVRPSGVLVRKGNPKKIRTLEDLARPGHTDSRCGGCRPVRHVGRHGPLGVADRRHPAQHRGRRCEHGEGVEKWKSMPELDAWIIFESWHYRLKDQTELVRLPEAQRVYRGTPIAITSISQEKALARDFIRSLKTAEGREIFVKWGWSDPPAAGLRR